MKKKKINLVYWHGENYGDALSPMLIEELTGLPVQYKKTTLSRSDKFKTLFHDICKGSFADSRSIAWPGQENLLCVGSIICWSNSRSLVWGSGFMNRSEEFQAGNVLAVRGKLTDEKLRSGGFIGCTVYGDPALLLPLWIKAPEQKKHKLGIIPHWKEVDHFKLHYGDRYTIIDLRSRDVEGVTREIASCEYVLASSLHGVIVAHAYGIPALWIQHGYIDTDGFKFHDYFSSIHVPMYNGFKDIEEILKSEESWRSLFEKYKTLSTIQTPLLKIQQGLLASFPYPLKEKYRTIIQNKNYH